MILPVIIRNKSDFKRSIKRLLRKYYDLSYGKKLTRIYRQQLISVNEGKSCDIEVCINELVQYLRCCMKHNQSLETLRMKKLINSLTHLQKKVSMNCAKNKKIDKKIITRCIVLHKELLASFDGRKLRLRYSQCDEPYQKVTMSSVCVWNNDWY